MNRIVVYFISIGLLTMASTGWGQQEGSAAAPQTGQSATMQPAAGSQTAQPGPAVGEVNAKGKKVKRSGSPSASVQPPSPAQSSTPTRAPRSGPSRGRGSEMEATAATIATCPECLARTLATCARDGGGRDCPKNVGRAPAAGSLPQKEVKAVDSGQ